MNKPPPIGQSKERAVVRAAIVLVLLSCTLLERFGLNPGGGGYALKPAMFSIYLLVGVAVIARQLVLSTERLLLYLVCLGVVVASMLINLNVADVDRSSMSSFLLLAVMYLPFVFVLKQDWAGADHANWVLEVFANIALFSAMAGIAQFAAQFVVRDAWLFDFTSYLPEAIRAQSGFNTVIPVGSLYKSNGFFYREPSGFSFIMALAIVLEVGRDRRWWRIACLGLALLLTYSGTGLLALFIGLLFPFGLKTLSRYVAAMLLGGLVLWSFGDALNLSFTVSRVGEFSSERSSAYIRYIAPLRLLNETMAQQPWSFWLGYGPGSITRTSADFLFHDPTWAKLLYEYGLVGFLSFVTFFVMALNRPNVPVSARVTLFFAWLIMGGHLLSPEMNYMTLVLVGLMPWVASPGLRPQASVPPRSPPTVHAAFRSASCAP